MQGDLGKVSNNHLIVLRKFPGPIGDNIFLPYSSEKKIYSDAVWEEIQKYI